MPGETFQREYSHVKGDSGNSEQFHSIVESFELRVQKVGEESWFDSPFFGLYAEGFELGNL